MYRMKFLEGKKGRNLNSFNSTCFWKLLDNSEREMGLLVVTTHQKIIVVLNIFVKTYTKRFYKILVNKSIIHVNK